MYLRLHLSVFLFVPILQRPVDHHSSMQVNSKTSRRVNRRGVIGNMRMGNDFWSHSYFSRKKWRDFQKLQQKMKLDKKKRVKGQRRVKAKKRWTEGKCLADSKGRQEKMRTRIHLMIRKDAEVDIRKRHQVRKGRNSWKRRNRLERMKIQPYEMKSAIRKKQLKRRRQIRTVGITKYKAAQRNKFAKKMGNDKTGVRDEVWNKTLGCKNARMKKVGKRQDGNKLAMNRKVRRKNKKMKRARKKKVRSKKARNKKARANKKRTKKARTKKATNRKATNRKVRIQKARDKKARIKISQRRFSRKMNETVKTSRCGNVDIPWSRKRRNGRFTLKKFNHVL